jgi:hypothetical protein
MGYRFVKPKRYCKYWKACPKFRRSECDDEVMETSSCPQYKERERQEREMEKKK